MMMLMSAALAAGAPVAPASPPADAHAQHMQMAGQSQDETDCCPCPEDMAAKPRGHEEHGGHVGQ